MLGTIFAIHVWEPCVSGMAKHAAHLFTSSTNSVYYHFDVCVIFKLCTASGRSSDSPSAVQPVSIGGKSTPHHSRMRSTHSIQASRASGDLLCLIMLFVAFLLPYRKARVAVKSAGGYTVR